MAKKTAKKKKTPQQRGRMSKRKGSNFEREIANRWKENGIFPDAIRGIGQARSAKEVSDVENTPFWVEAKAQKKPNVFKALEQAEQATDGRPCIVVAKKDREPIVVAMRLDEFEKLLKSRL